jgi:arylsulfatase A-like enzyme
VPGAKPHRVMIKRSAIDFVPTVLDLLEIPQPPPGDLSGQSNAAAIVAPEDAALEERDVFCDMPPGTRVSRHRAFLHGPTPGMKLMSEGGAVYLMFDLSKDPGELSDLSVRDRPTLRRLLDAFDEKLSSLHEIRVDPAADEGR